MHDERDLPDAELEPGDRWPFVSVVVPVRNGADTIRDCVEALDASDYPPEHREIIVVDNASTDRTAARLVDLPVRVVHEPIVGRSHARNRGVHESRGEIVAFTDADCIPEPRWLLELAAQLQSARAGCAAGELADEQARTPAQRFMSARRPVRQQQALACPAPFVITANVAFRREVFTEVGLFDPSFVTAEDVDFSWRCHAAGVNVAYCPNAIVVHRLRRTAWSLFRQQLGLGYGRALLRDRYELNGEVGLPSWLGVAWSAAALLLAIGRRAGGDRRTYAAYELLVVLGLQLGALRHAAARATRTGAQTPD